MIDIVSLLSPNLTHALNRIMVGLPSKESRELILKKLLSKENVEGVDYQELAAMTDGYTGSDLKVCMFPSLQAFCDTSE